MVSSLNGPVFLKAVDTLGEYKDTQYMGKLFIKVIEDIGVDSCVQIITDTAPVCKAAGMTVETKYPQVFWTTCIVHSLNLALKSIAADVLWIVTLLRMHSISVTLYQIIQMPSLSTRSTAIYHC